MADSDRALSLDLLCFVPLPYRIGDDWTHQLGVSIYYADLLPRLVALGHRVRVIAEAPARGPAPLEAIAPGLALPGIEVRPFAFAYRSGREPADPDWCRTTRAALEPLLDAAVADRRPDLVLVGREILAPVLVEACRQRGLPTAVFAHGVTLHSIARQDHPEDARTAVLAGLRGASGVVAIAHHLAADLRARGVERVRAVPNAADASRFEPGPPDPSELARLGLAPGDVVAAQVSGLKPSKRPLDVVRAAELAAVRAPRLVHLVAGGGGEREQVERAVRDRGLADRFRFTGEIEHARMPSLMRAVHLLVLASEHEGLPLVFGEAQASGCVIVASDIPAAREVLVDGETGVLFRTGDPVDLAEKLVRLAGDPEERARIGRQARAAALAWTRDHAAAATSRALGEIAAEIAAGMARAAPS